jgi:hypothetical protein
MSKTVDDVSYNENPIPPAAQRIVKDIIGQLRQSNDLSSILQFAIEALTAACQADRGLVWQVDGDQLAVTNECAINGQMCLVGSTLDSMESTHVVLEFLSRFPDESSEGTISIPDTRQDSDSRAYPTLSSQLESKKVRARLLTQLRSRGIFSGFIELQHCDTRLWTELDFTILNNVAALLSIVVQQSFDRSKIEMDAKEMKVINEIGNIFRESCGLLTQNSLAQSVRLISEWMSFGHARAYLLEKALLIDVETGESLESTSPLTVNLRIVGKGGSGSCVYVALEVDRSAPERTQKYTGEITKEITATSANRNCADSDSGDLVRQWVGTL